jgi:hypothetical protein
MELYWVQDLFSKEEAFEKCLVLITFDILFSNQYVFDFSQFCFQYR